MSAAATSPSALETLERLRGVERDAKHRRHAAEHAAEAGAWERHREVTRPLREYTDDVRFRRRQPDAAEAKRVSDDLLETIAEEGLQLAASSAGHGELLVVDPRVAVARDATEAAYREARLARQEFQRASADKLRVDRDRAEMERIRAALAGDDPTAARSALS